MRDHRSGKPPRIPELDQEFDLVRVLGKGGTAVVYLARDRAISRDVAIKLISPSHVRDEDARARLIREARTVAKLQHPNIVMLLGTRALSGGGLALILQYVPGRTLKERIQEEGALPYPEVERVLRDVGQALGYAHRQRIAHRDIKPENIYLDESCDLARLADFGIARAWDSDSGLTLPGAAIGTPAYMSPEQVDGDELDGRSDLYGLGLVGYEMLTGRQPWAGESLYNVIYKQKHEELPPLTDSCPDIPPRLRRAIEGAIRKERDDRWPNAETFLQVLAGDPTVGSEAGAGPTAIRRTEEEQAREAAPHAGGRPGFDPKVLMVPDAAAGPEEWPESEEEPPLLVGPPAPLERRPRVALGALILLGVVALGLAIEAVVSGPGGYAHSLFGYVAPIIGSETNGEAFPPTRPSTLDEAAAGEGGDSRPADAETTPSDAESVRAALVARGLLPDSVASADPEAAAGFDPETTPLNAGTVERPEAGFPARAEVVRGTGQEGTSDAVLPEPLEVRVLDSGGAPLAGRTVRFQTAEGSGRVEPATSRTNDQGVAQAFWVLGPGTGEQAVTASVAASPSVSTRFTARASSPRIAVRAGVAAGGSHTCLIGADGVIRCWGRNDDGQLGDGSLSRRTAAGTPVPQGPFAAVAAGMSHVCALDVDGRALCWGSNAQGQLGSSAPEQSTPTPVEGAARFSELAAGGAHTCGLTPAGAAFCWGDNQNGQLGDGSQARRGAPARVRSDRVLRQITAGWGHTCALDDGGAAWCWGSNQSGELGVEGDSPSAVPRAVPGEHRFSSISAGASHTCGVRTDGSALCWGSNQRGQLGEGSRMIQTGPTEVVGEESFREVAAGGVHSCGLTTEGRAFCWGGNPYGQVGDGGTTDRVQPVAVAGNRSFASLQAFGSHTCGRTPAGEVLCWGYNVDGQLGDGTRENRLVPTGR